jgi:alpha-D-xyloside xylohydrolase
VPKEPAAGAPPNILPNQAVTWEGTVESPLAGQHKFQLYGSSYFKVFVDDQLVLDRWRQNWAAWYQNFTVDMQAGKPVKIRIEWIPQDGYIALLHNNPLPDAERHSLTLTSDVGRAIDYYFVAGNSQDEVIAGYRQLTGKAVLLPKWAYGFLAEPPALHQPAGVAGRGDRVSQAENPARQHRARLVLLERGFVGLP